MGNDELTWSGMLDNEDEATGDQCTGQVTPRSFLLPSFAFSPGSGNAEGSSNGLGDFPLLVFFFVVFHLYFFFVFLPNCRGLSLTPLRRPPSIFWVFPLGYSCVFPPPGFRSNPPCFLLWFLAFPPCFFFFSPLCYSSSTRSLFPVFFTCLLGFYSLAFVPLGLASSLALVFGSLLRFVRFFSSWFLFFFVWVQLEFFLGFSFKPPLVLCSALPFIRPKSFKNHHLHERDRGNCGQC